MDPLIHSQIEVLQGTLYTVAHKRGLLETIPGSVHVGKVMARVVVLLAGASHKGQVGSASPHYLRTSLIHGRETCQSTVDQAVETLIRKGMAVKVDDECTVVRLTEFGWTAVPMCTLMERAHGWRKKYREKEVCGG